MAEGADGNQKAGGPGSDQKKVGIGFGLFESLEKGVLGLSSEKVGLVDNGDLAGVEDGFLTKKVGYLADLLDGVILVDD